jgi:hypothetical protein
MFLIGCEHSTLCYDSSFNHSFLFYSVIKIQWHWTSPSTLLPKHINDYGINILEIQLILYICKSVANITEFFNEIVKISNFSLSVMLQTHRMFSYSLCPTFLRKSIKKYIQTLQRFYILVPCCDKIRRWEMGCIAFLVTIYYSSTYNSIG